MLEGRGIKWDEMGEDGRGWEDGIGDWNLKIGKRRCKMGLSLFRWIFTDE